MKRKEQTTIYADAASTTPLHPEVLKTLQEAQKNISGNPMSVHHYGKKAQQQLDNAREQVATLLNANHPGTILFTSGATEGNNTVLKSHTQKQENQQKPHIIISQIEHDSVYQTAKTLESQQLIELTCILPNKEGIIQPETVKEAIKENTTLVSIMLVNNEIGTIQPIHDIGRIVRTERKRRIKEAKPSIYMHTDATQAVNSENLDLKTLLVDYLTLSGHKCYGPKGVGVLYKHEKAPLTPLLHGGGQEREQRSSTHNTPAIIAMIQALTIAQTTREDYNKRLREHQQKFISFIQKHYPEVKINGNLEKRIPNNIHLSLPRIDQDILLLLLDKKGIAASQGSACSAGVQATSRTIQAIQEARQQIAQLRITFLNSITTEEREKLQKILSEIITEHS